MSVDEAILSRRSVRAFKPTPIPRATIEHVLEVAARAPSGTNMQPWRVHVATGAVKEQITREVLAAFDAQEAGHEREYKYYPDQLRPPYIDRRRKVGWDMYGLLGIGKADRDKMHAQHGRNYAFFGAPVGLFFTIDRDMEIGSWLDHGMFLENVMLAARGQGLATCPQAAWPPYHKIVRNILGFAPEEVLVSGMSMGYEDETAVVNQLRTERAPLKDFVRFAGF
jgi:nitroreductase